MLGPWSSQDTGVITFGEDVENEYESPKNKFGFQFTEPVLEEEYESSEDDLEFDFDPSGVDQDYEKQGTGSRKKKKF